MSKNSDKVRAWRRRQRKFLQKYKERPCMDCGMQYPYYVMQFDHVRGHKAFPMSSPSATRSMARMQEEIAKCDVVCANCHAERTYSGMAER